MTENSKKTKVILDFDNTMGLPKHEIDDGLTLLYLLSREDIAVLGITTTFGNGSLEEVDKATEALIAFIGKEIPVYSGAREHGKAGTDAAQFLVETVSAFPDEVTILAIGPLGNLGAAAEIDAGFFGKCKEIVCMGGMLKPMRLGWRDIDELNFSSDPEGAYAVLRNQKCPVTVMNAHVCLDAVFGYFDMQRVLYMPKYVRRSIFKWLFVFGTYFGVFKFYLWDLLPAVYLPYPDLFESRRGKITSSVEDLEDGRLIFSETEKGNINMPSAIKDVKKFKKILFRGWRMALDTIAAYTKKY